MPDGAADRHDGTVTATGRRGVATAAVTAAGSVAVLAARVAAGAVPVGDLLAAGPALVPVGLGGLISRRVPSSPAAAPLAWIGAAVLAVAALPGAWAATGGLWGADLAARIGEEGFWPWQLLPLVWLLAVFPDGKRPGRRWTLLALAAPVGAVLVTGSQAVWGGEPVPPPVALILLLSSFALILTGLGGAVGALVARHRRGGERTRLQLRWLVLAGGSVAVLLPAGWGAEALGAPVEVAYTGFLLAMLVLVPAAVTVAIVRHDLFDVDRLLGASLAWLLSTVSAAGVFAAIVLLTGELVGERIGVTGAAFVTALCLLPLHRRLQELVGRVADPDRTVRLAEVRRFVERVRDGQAEPEEVQQVLRRALDDPAARLLLHAPGQHGGHVDLGGGPAEPDPGAPQVPLRTSDAEVGVLVLGAGSARRLRRAREAALAARLPIEVSRLRLALRGALADVHASRLRLVAAGAEERRRLERDLHDGAQQQIVAVAMRLQAVQRRLGRNSEGYGELAAAVQLLEGTLTELRRLAHGLRPSRLDDGLGSALAHLARDGSVPVDLAVEPAVDAAPLPDLVATTAYFVVVEAVANALKHAAAAQVRVAVGLQSDSLVVTVTDDGIGGARDGFGLTSLRDRVASAGGRVEVASPVGGGTTVTAVIPCGP